jgi:glucose/mannose-6-phosphate isomerase
MLFENLSSWPHRLKKGAEVAEQYYQKIKGKLPKQIKNIVFSGMGGSGIASRIIQTFLDASLDVPSFILDTCNLPHFVDSQTLAIVISYSGNTWETIYALDALLVKNVFPIIATHGGRIEEIARAKDLAIALIPNVETPRSALGFFLGFILKLLELMNVYKGSALIESFSKQASLNLPRFMEVSTFRAFLDKLHEREFFHVWGIRGDSAACAYRAQTQFNENSKLQAVFSVFPELCHNLIASFTETKIKPLVIFFRTDSLTPPLKKAADATDEILLENGVDLYKPPVLGDTFENQLFNMILWADFASCYAANQRNVAIDAVRLIDRLKEKHRQKGLTI